MSQQNGEKCNQSDCDYGIIVGARQGGLSISETVDLLIFSHITVFAENGVKNKKRIQWEWFEENGQTGQSWPERDSNANDRTLQQWYAEEYLWTHNI